MTRSANGRSCRHCGKFVHPSRRGSSPESRPEGRGLCRPCWLLLGKTGELADYERPTRSRDDLLDDYVVLRGQGHDWRQCAERLGMTYPSFERAMLRARKAGDPRARRIGETRCPAAEQAA